MTLKITYKKTKQYICKACRGNHFITWWQYDFGKYPPKDNPAIIKDLYSDQARVYNCPSCVDNLKNDF
jgi:ribosomal protein L37AE/L43A